MIWKRQDWSCEEDTRGQGWGGEEDIKSQSWGYTCTMKSLCDGKYVLSYVVIHMQ